MAGQFKTIGLIGRYHNSAVSQTVQDVFQYLQKRGLQVAIEAQTATVLAEQKIHLPSLANFDENCDLFIVVGGDGSLLNASHLAVNYDVPMVGINRGHLGFLTDISPTDYERELDHVLAGEFVEERRFLLDAKLCQGEQCESRDHALNDVVLKQGNIPHMLEYEIYVNDKFMCSESSDGLIIATPTGSTAYALAGGGPILHPGLNAMLLMPMFSHTLSSRPIVLSGDKTVTIYITKNNFGLPTLRCDSQDMVKVPLESTIEVRKHKKSLRLLHPTDYNYFESLRSKLGWGRKHH